MKTLLEFTVFVDDPNTSRYRVQKTYDFFFPAGAAPFRIPQIKYPLVGILREVDPVNDVARYDLGQDIYVPNLDTLHAMIQEMNLGGWSFRLI